MTESQTAEGRRYIVVVQDSAAVELCPAELIVHDVPEGEVRGDLYPALRFPEGDYTLVFGGTERGPVTLRMSDAEPPPAMVVLSDVDPPDVD
ncbi:MAG TPA: hypothetical protein QF624_06745 [Dehalococcoidia bacterium]|nr:hypothetical protein [Dehalococcoidia bacterium]